MKTGSSLTELRNEIERNKMPLLLWLPVNTKNRTAFLSKNITRDENYTEDDGICSQHPFRVYIDDEGGMTSYNPNCGTDYKIIEVPAWVTSEVLHAVGGMLSEEDTHPFDCIRQLGAWNIAKIKQILK